MKFNFCYVHIICLYYCDAYSFIQSRDVPLFFIFFLDLDFAGNVFMYKEYFSNDAKHYI